jgi:hypothetical protein
LFILNRRPLLKSIRDRLQDIVKKDVDEKVTKQVNFELLENVAKNFYPTDKPETNIVDAMGRKIMDQLKDDSK